MSYESADYVNQLDVNLPKGTDSISEGDIHIRLLKEVLKQSFPNVNEPVNAIHTGPEPILKSAGTVWYDIGHTGATGLIKLWDGSEWLNMAHGSASGLGSLLNISWFDFGSVQDRWQGWTEIFSASINPLSTTSSLIFEFSGQASCSGYGSSEALLARIHNKTSDEFYEEVKLVGFQHVSDADNFQIYAGFCGRQLLANHGMGQFEIGLQVKEETVETSAGATVSNARLSVAEVE